MIAFPARPGLVVALLGPDGAGKSGLVASLAMSSPLPVRARYMGLYQAGAPTQRKRRRGASGLFRLAMVTSVSVRSWLDRRRGRVVILDRHVYDLLMRAGARRAQLRRAVYLRVGIRPDITIVLDAPPEILHERRPEQSVDQSAEERARYGRIAGAVPGAVIVDATQPLVDVAASVNAIVWDRLVSLSHHGS
jgi:thymidylate kinase